MDTFEQRLKTGEKLLLQVLVYPQGEIKPKLLNVEGTKEDLDFFCATINMIGDNPPENFDENNEMGVRIKTPVSGTPLWDNPTPPKGACKIHFEFIHEQEPVGTCALCGSKKVDE